MRGESGMMNRDQKEKLKRVLQEIMNEQINGVLDETSAIMTEILQEKCGSPRQAPVAQPRGAEIAGHCAPVPSPARSGSVTRDNPEDTSVQEKIQSVCRVDPAQTGSHGVNDETGLYLYGIARCPTSVRFEAMGIDRGDVFTIAYRDLSAIVHTCPARPYESNDKAVVQEWVMVHQNVINRVSEQCGTVMPFSFDTIIKPDGDKSAREMLILWMTGEYDGLESKLRKIAGKSEYGVQIFYTPLGISERIADTNPAIKKLQEETKSHGPGTEYMIRQKIEQELKSSLEVAVRSLVQDCYQRIKDSCDDIRMEPIKKSTDPDEKMLLNCSCLASDENYLRLGEVLETIQHRPGLKVRFTGPWQAYSFV